MNPFKLLSMNGFSKMTTYLVRKIDQPLEINSEWSKFPWEAIEPLELKRYMGNKPEYKLEVQAKMAYDDEALYIIFRVEDRYVKCTRTEYQDEVYKDSAVEFFFIPSEDPNKGYFNLEVNCGGTALFKFRSKEKGVVLVCESVFSQIKIAHSMPKTVNPEIENEVTWTIEMRIPVDILEQYSLFTHPASGAKWRVNFYKIADDSSHPHYLTWSEVIHPKPNFHLPEFFGTIVFE